LICFILVRHTNNIKEITQFRPVWLLKLLHFHILVPSHILRVRAYNVMVVSESIDVPSEDGL
jgi:hypothetical protein